ncbi:ArnT family glycosyltransferase [Candidatus Latescibacterota bacterium]
MSFLQRHSTLAGLALVAVHFLFVAIFHEPALSGPDANGYFAQAKALATEGHSYQELESPLQFSGAHWVNAGDGRYFSKYPPGYPLILAIPYRLFGPTASLWVDPLMVSGALLALFFLCRQWLGTPWALAATALMAANPHVNQHAVPGFAHTAVAFFLMWGLYALARWTRSASPGWLALAGLCVGMVPTARYAEVLYVGAFAIYVLLRLHSMGEAWRRAAPLAVAALPTGLLALRNHLAFGAFWRTGYAVSGEQTGFGFGYFADHWVSYLESLSGSGVGMLFALGIVGMVALVAERESRNHGILLLALVVPTTLLYMAYYWGGGMGGLRFLVPTFYLYALAAVWLLRELVTRMGRPAVWATATVIALAILWGLPRSGEELARRQRGDASLASLTDTVRQYVPAGSVLFADRMTSQHLDVMGNWRLGQMEALMAGGQDRFPGMGGPRGDVPPEAGRLGPARLMHGSIRGSDTNATAALEAPQASETPARAAPNPMAGGSRQRLERYRDLGEAERSELVLADLEAWVGDAGQVYVLAPRQALAMQLDHMGLGQSWRELTTIELPTPEGDDMGAGPMGRGRFGRRRPSGMAGRMPRRAMGMMAMRPFGGSGGLGMPGVDSPVVLAVVSL